MKNKYSLKHRLAIVAHLIAIALLATSAIYSQSRLLDVTIESKNFSHNKIGIASKRNVTIYLPAGYAGGAKRFPVVYYLHNFFEDNRSLYSNYDAQALFDRAIKNQIIAEVIVVAADFGTPFGGSIYTNSSVTGDWEDFMVEELVPHIDANFRTLSDRNSRGITGDRIGGYGAIRFAMRHPNIFGSVYALHPVGTGTGVQLMYSRPNWELLANAKSADDLKGDFLSSIFTAIFQAHLPDPRNPPLFISAPARRIGNELAFDTALTERLHDSFFLPRMVPQFAENLKKLKAFKFDWGRGDWNYDHIYANQAFTRKLNEFGIAHEAEEYSGGWGDKHWGENGRVYTDLLPFFNEHLVFEPPGTARADSK